MNNCKGILVAVVARAALGKTFTIGGPKLIAKPSVLLASMWFIGVSLGFLGVCWQRGLNGYSVSFSL